MKGLIFLKSAAILLTYSQQSKSLAADGDLTAIFLGPWTLTAYRFVAPQAKGIYNISFESPDPFLLAGHYSRAWKYFQVMSSPLK